MKMEFSGKKNGVLTKKQCWEDGALCLLNRNTKGKMDFYSNGVNGKKNSQVIIKLSKLGLKN